MSLASLLLLWGTEYHVFRAVVLSIVATLAIGPNAALLCSAWCHPQAAAPSTSHHCEPPATASGASHHGEPSAASSASHHAKPSAGSSVAGDESCDNCNNAVGAAPFVREDLRTASVPEVDHAVLALRHQLAHLMIDARPGQEPGGEGSLEARRLPGILRI